VLKGKFVGLRAIEKNDLPQLMEWRNRPEFRKNFREYREINSDKQLKWYENFVLNDSNTIMFSIVTLDSNRLLGACGLCYINWVNRSADFSIYLGADDIYLDDKYAPDVARVMMQYGFNELCLHRLWSEVYSIDFVKQRFFENLGFILDGRHRQTYWYEGKFHDSYFYSLLSTDDVII
jgi:RimJ/RimL family protein N-acetyltransferase